MSSKNRRIFSLVALLLFVSAVCLADSAFAGKAADWEEDYRKQVFSNSLRGNR